MEGHESVKMLQRLVPLSALKHLGQPEAWTIATSTHLANHINNSLTKLTFCRGSSIQSESDSKFDNDDCWRFFDGLMEGQQARREEDLDHLPGTRDLRFLDLLYPTVTEELLRR